MPERPVILLAFANDRRQPGRFLRELSREQDKLPEILDREFEIKLRPAVSRDKIKEVFLIYRERIKIFHYGGHAGKTGIETEEEADAPALTYAEGLAEFIGMQEGVQLIFLNGCSTKEQVAFFHRSRIPCVIATTQPVGDQLARKFSEAFYKSLTAGSSIRKAFEEARSAMRMDPATRARTRSMDWGKTNENFPYSLEIDPRQKQAGEEGLAGWTKADPQPSKVIPAPAPQGAKTYLLCNRIPENNTFRDEIRHTLRDPNRRPHVFLLHGPFEELPGSLADRFYEFTVRDILNSLREPLAPGKFVRYPVGFPTSDDFESRHPDKAFIRLQERFDHAGLDLPDHGRDIMRKVGKQRRIVLIEHRLMARNWHPQMPAFIRRYITEFWDLTLRQDQPQIVVLFNLTYHLDKGLKGLLKRRLDKQIETELVRLTAEIETCHFLDRLPPVWADDVAEWLGDHLKHRSEVLREIFGNKSKVSMNRIEPVLMREIQLLNERMRND